jgi:subtilase family serine protease
MVDKALALCLILIYPFFYATAEAKPPEPLSTKAPADLVIDSVKVTSYNSSSSPSYEGEAGLIYSGSQQGLFLLPGDGSDNEVTVVVRNQGFSDISRSFQVSLSLARGRSLSPVSGGTYELTVPNLSSGQSYTLKFTDVKVSCALKGQPGMVYVARVDSRKRITEASKTNNARSLDIQKNTTWFDCP